MQWKTTIAIICNLCLHGNILQQTPNFRLRRENTAFWTLVGWGLLPHVKASKMLDILGIAIKVIVSKAPLLCSLVKQSYLILSLFLALQPRHYQSSDTEHITPEHCRWFLGPSHLLQQSKRYFYLYKAWFNVHGSITLCSLGLLLTQTHCTSCPFGEAPSTLASLAVNRASLYSSEPLVLCLP